MATDRTLDGSTQILAGIRAAVRLSQSESVQALGPAWVAGARHRLARYLEVAALAVAALAIALGLALLAYGITVAVTGESGHPYPNTQHVSPTPTPRG